MLKQKIHKKESLPSNMLHIGEFRDRFSSLEQHLRSVQSEIEELQTLTSKLLDVGVAISSEIDLFALLTRIIDEAKGLLKAERGTLYLVDRNTNELYFHVTDAAQIQEVRIPINDQSISGYVALTRQQLNIDDVYKLDKKNPYSFNKKIDRRTGYRTRSMLTVPMLNHESNVTGVVQLINRNIDGKVQAFSARDQRILMSLASQAAVAIENAQLYKEIAELFEAFIRYSSSAIDERDPATAGHSRRVAMYATALARALGCFTEEQIKEINYASWLHDVGKIGVREQILVKENKLYPHQFEKVCERFDAIKLSLTIDHLHRRHATVIKKHPEEKLRELDDKFAAMLQSVDDDIAFIIKINKPGFMNKDDSKRLGDISKKKFKDSAGKSRPYITHDERESLRVIRGNLTDEEREIMNAHATSTYRILSQIPFTQNLRLIPEIAASHHEKLDGSGYPQGLRSKQLPIQSKIIALVDIYDALTAQDRPYKPAMPVDKSLKILEAEVRDKRLDNNIFMVFVDNKIFELKDPGDKFSAEVNATSTNSESKKKK